MRRVAAGESFTITITITVNDRPVADLVPHKRVQLRRSIPAEELDALMADLPPMDVDSWARDATTSPRTFMTRTDLPPRRDG